MKERSIKIVLFEYYYGNGVLWFRIFGAGLLCKNVKKRGFIFSEREGHTKYIMIGKYLIRVLKYGKFNKI